MTLLRHSTLSLAIAAAIAVPAHGATFSLTIDGPDAIFLAGRTDVTVPAANLPWNTGTFLARHAGPTPEEALEQFPSSIPVNAGQTVRVLDQAVGGVNFFNGLGPPFFGPSGNGASGSNLLPLGGISGYIGPQGALAGVFLTDAIPDSGPPTTLDFTPGGLGLDFASLSPLIGQVFYIGDGVTGGGDFQQFIAPTGATRLFLGIPDGFSFQGVPGAYDDNDGSYRITVGIDEIPQIPEPSTLALLALGLAGLGVLKRRRG